MNVAITIANEDALMQAFRANLQREARRAVVESTNRAGKRYANVTMPMPHFQWMYYNVEPKIDWV